MDSRGWHCRLNCWPNQTALTIEFQYHHSCDGRFSEPQEAILDDEVHGRVGAFAGYAQVPRTRGLFQWD